MADPFVTFPGTAGNYASRADTNLLDADSAHIVQSGGRWTNSGGMVGNGVVTASAQSAFGPNVLRCEVGTTGTLRQMTTTGGGAPYTPVIAGDVSVSLTITNLSVTQLPAIFQLNCRDVGGSSVNVLTLNDDFPAIGETETFVWQGVAGAGTTQAWITVLLSDGIDGEQYDLSGVCLRQDLLETFVPSLRIVGDLDLRADATIRTLDLNKALISLWDSTTTKLAIMATGGGGNMACFYSPDGSATFSEASTSGDVLIIDERHAYRVALQVDNGAGGITIEYFTDGVSKGTSVVPGAITLSGAGTEAEVGTIYKGTSSWQMPMDCYSAEVRDGIDGPIVAQFRAQDLIGAVPL